VAQPWKTPDFISFLATGTLGAKGSGSYQAMIDALFNEPNYLAAKKLMDATAVQFRASAQKCSRTLRRSSI
jgi:hypothetical protein